MRNRGQALHPDADRALQLAVGMINGYKGHPILQPDVLLFTQQAVLDSLPTAPTPIGYAWMRITLSAVGGLGRWAHSTGQPLTREHLLCEETRYRYIEWAARHNEWAEMTKNTTWDRLQLIGDFLLGGTPRELRKPTITEEAPVIPLTLNEQADLWVWAKTLSVKKRVKRMTAFIALGLGCGLTGGELARAVREDAVIDADGAVHVTVTNTKGTRTVTCVAHWEERLADIVRAVEPGHLLTAPWRTDPGPGSSNESVRRAMVKNPPVVFNSIRLRNTWLCWHLQHGTPLKELMEASGMKEANHLHNLLPLLPDTDPTRSARLLRGNPPRPPVTLQVPDSTLSITVAFQDGTDHE
jgi:integrase